MRKEWYPFLALVLVVVSTIVISYFSSSNISFSPTGLPSNIICEDLECLIKCIKITETGGQSNNGCDAIGDNGDSHGPYQIQQSMIDYAARYDNNLSGIKATDLSGKTGNLTCAQRISLSEKIMNANWGQSATANTARKDRKWTCEDLARIHNGGPSGHTKKATLGYWDKVKECMAKKC